MFATARVFPAPDDPGSRSARKPGIRRGWLDLAWTALSLLNVVAIIVRPSPDTVPFHLLSISFAVLYSRRIWPANPMLWGLGIVIITTFAAIGFDLLKDAGRVEEVGEMPLMAAMCTSEARQERAASSRSCCPPSPAEYRMSRQRRPAVTGAASCP